MRYSKLFAKTNKSAKQYDSLNATLLQKAGFVEQLMAGVYSYLPLGSRVLSKIENIVREEMNKIGQEVFLPSLAPKETWEATGRLETIDVLMKTVGANESSRLKNSAEYVLNCTHEDIITPIVKKFSPSYRDLPVALYQIQTKFRNEPRAKSGLMRGREFRMKDLYSFHPSVESLKEYYEASKEIYTNVFRRVGLGELTHIALASGGDFTDDFSHEFQTRCEAGEDIIFHAKSVGIHFNREVAPSKAPVVESGDEHELPREDVLGEGIIGVDELAKFLNIPVEKTTKTMLFETDKGEVIAAAVRGGYEINEEKLRKVVGCKSLKLARESVVKEVTGAEVGYAGPIGLPDSVKVFFDDSTDGRKNFECGANKTHYHTINANFGRDIHAPEKFYDFKLAKEGDLYPDTGEEYEVYSASEVGNIFPLNTKFSELLDYYYTDENGERKIVYMGSYGIGTSRLMGVVAEVLNDDNGLIWPMSIAPYQVHLITLGKEGEESFATASKLYQELTDAGVEVLYDERDVRAGEKFADADLIGIPVRLVVSQKTLSSECVEMKLRGSDESSLVEMSSLLSTVQTKVKELLEN